VTGTQRRRAPPIDDDSGYAARRPRRRPSAPPHMSLMFGRLSAVAVPVVGDVLGDVQSSAATPEAVCHSSGADAFRGSAGLSASIAGEWPAQRLLGTVLPRRPRSRESPRRGEKYAMGLVSFDGDRSALLACDECGRFLTARDEPSELAWGDTDPRELANQFREPKETVRAAGRAGWYRRTPYGDVRVRWSCPSCLWRRR
jgi:hypothetical protein